MSLLYTAGMFLNDAFDRDFDASVASGSSDSRRRRDGARSVRRRLGDCSRPASVLVAIERNAAALAWALLLAGAIVYYDYRHKQNPFGPGVMGVCRGLVYCVAAAASSAVTLRRRGRRAAR